MFIVAIRVYSLYVYIDEKIFQKKYLKYFLKRYFKYSRKIFQIFQKIFELFICLGDLYDLQRMYKIPSMYEMQKITKYHIYEN